jgi:putative flippase GtrA
VPHSIHELTWEVELKLITLYAILALLATIVNLVVQWVVDQTLAPETLWVPIFWGTAAGLLIKYELDKRFIFGVRPDGRRRNGTMFVLYSIMGLFTTAIFWGFEWLFYWLISAAWAQYAGATVGLAIGYWVKYHLDKRFVFREQNA